MAQSFDTSKKPEKLPRVSLKLAPGQTVAAMSALDRVEEHINLVAPYWGALTSDQTQDLINHSPVLARFLALAGRLETR